MKTTAPQIMMLIHHERELYLVHIKTARRRLNLNYENMTAQQVAQENIYIQDMESRVYALDLLLEEINDIECQGEIFK